MEPVTHTLFCRVRGYLQNIKRDFWCLINQRPNSRFTSQLSTQLLLIFITKDLQINMKIHRIKHIHYIIYIFFVCFVSCERITQQFTRHICSNIPNTCNSYGFAIIFIFILWLCHHFFFWKPKYKFISYLNINVDQSTKPLLQSGGESSNQTLLDNGLESQQYVFLQIDNTNANPSKCFESDQSRHVQVWTM